jgi:hypothetical protein
VQSWRRSRREGEEKLRSGAKENSTRDVALQLRRGKRKEDVGCSCRRRNSSTGGAGADTSAPFRVALPFGGR